MTSSKSFTRSSGPSARGLQNEAITGTPSLIPAQADEKLTAFLELELAIRACPLNSKAWSKSEARWPKKQPGRPENKARHLGCSTITYQFTQNKFLA
jgi:hypothetical protein